MVQEAEAAFFDKFAIQFPTREYDDDDEDDFVALIVTDEMPINVCLPHATQ